jgi:hypothetical protein
VWPSPQLALYLDQPLELGLLQSVHKKKGKVRVLLCKAAASHQVLMLNKRHFSLRIQQKILNFPTSERDVTKLAQIEIFEYFHTLVHQTEYSASLLFLSWQ